VRAENLTKAAKIAQQESNINSLNSKLKHMEEEVDHTGEQRDHCKNDNHELNDKIIKLEQELYESKSISIELLEKLRDLEL